MTDCDEEGDCVITDCDVEGECDVITDCDVEFDCAAVVSGDEVWDPTVDGLFVVIPELWDWGIVELIWSLGSVAVLVSVKLTQGEAGLLSARRVLLLTVVPVWPSVAKEYKR